MLDIARTFDAYLHQNWVNLHPTLLARKRRRDLKKTRWLKSIQPLWVTGDG